MNGQFWPIILFTRIDQPIFLQTKKKTQLKVSVFSFSKFFEEVKVSSANSLKEFLCCYEYQEKIKAEEKRLVML